MTSMIYEIRVDGRLPEHSREGFCGLHLEEVPMGLILRGMVIDESHLLGIISEFRRLDMRVVSVRPSSRPDRGEGRPISRSPAQVSSRRSARRLRRRAP
jgi:hypothetical protein